MAVDAVSDPVSAESLPEMLPEPELAAVPPSPHSRRRLLAAGVSGLAGLILGALGRPQTAQAAAGSSLIIGSATNNAGISNTQLTTSSNVTAFTLLQNGPGTALMGYATPTSGSTRGVYGRTDSPAGAGVQARNAGAHGAGAAIQAYGGSNFGLDASSSDTAVRGVLNPGGTTFGLLGTVGMGSALIGVGGVSPTGAGVEGSTDSGVGVYGGAITGTGVSGNSDSDSGVQGSSGTGTGVSGQSDSGYAVYGFSGSGYALWGQGNAAVTGDLDVKGALSKASGSFKIDHPLDPANKYLLHSFVESPDMMNVYNGIATLDARGEATVELPGWFEALNRDFRYQLTPIGPVDQPLYVKSKVKNNRFSIGGGKTGQEVSWQLTGIRKDAWANAHRIEVEEAKTGDEKGLYLHPKEHGQSAAKGIKHPAPAAVKAPVAPPAPVGLRQGQK